MKKVLIFLLFLLFITTIYAQNRNIEFDKKEFPNKPNELLTAKSQIKNGEISFFGGNYDSALKLFLKANNFNPSNSLLNFYIGVCYYNSAQKYKALEYVEKAYNLNPNLIVKELKDIRFYLARAYHLNYKFDSHIAAYIIILNERRGARIFHFSVCNFVWLPAVANCVNFLV